MSSRVDGSSAMDGMQGSESEEGRSLPVPDPKPKRNRERHKAWSFEDTFQISCSERTQADGPGDLQQNISFVRHRIRERLQSEQPRTVSSVTIFFDSSLLSRMSDSISIAVRGYIQSTQAIVSTSMKNWISSAFSWTPVTGGLASNADFQNNMLRSEDANDAWTRLIIFGSVGMNNHGREAQKNARKVG